MTRARRMARTQCRPRRRRRWGEWSSALHRDPQAARSHVRPDLVDVIEALLPAAAEPLRSPAGRKRAVGCPDRILFLVIEHNQVLRWAGNRIAGRSSSLLRGRAWKRRKMAA